MYTWPDIRSVLERLEALQVNYAVHAFIGNKNTRPISMKVQQAIKRTTGPNICLFVLILMHSAC